jgi:hypothetical protein
MECLNDLIAKIEKLPKLANKTYFVYTQDDLMATSNKIVYPAIGVIYEGLKAKDENGGKGTKMGLSADLHCAIVLLTPGSAIGKIDYKKDALDIISDIRSMITKTRSPAGHYWNFLVESPVMDIEGAFGYYIRFNTPIMLT